MHSLCSIVKADTGYNIYIYNQFKGQGKVKKNNTLVGSEELPGGLSFVASIAQGELISRIQMPLERSPLQRPEKSQLS